MTASIRTHKHAWWWQQHHMHFNKGGHLCCCLMNIVLTSNSNSRQVWSHTILNKSTLSAVKFNHQKGKWWPLKLSYSTIWTTCFQSIVKQNIQKYPYVYILCVHFYCVSPQYSVHTILLPRWFKLWKNCPKMCFFKTFWWYLLLGILGSYLLVLAIKWSKIAVSFYVKSH